jgi:vacuolar protein sorting-associated protein 29
MHILILVMSSASSFTDFGELVLVIGDFHVPFQKPCVPAVFKELLNTDKIKTILCTGNVCCDEIIEELLQITSNLHIVRGHMDATVTSRELPDSAQITIGQFKVGLISGHQIIPHGDHDALGAVQRKMGCDILVYGSASNNEIFQSCGKFFVNPGSVTGAVNNATSPSTPSIPSFMLMAIQGPSAVVYVYELVDGKANVSLSEFSKSS